MPRVKSNGEDKPRVLKIKRETSDAVPRGLPESMCALRTEIRGAARCRERVDRIKIPESG